MKKNVGKIDRILRIIIGLVIIALGILFKSWWGVIGVVILLTGLLNICLFYIPFKINTAKKD